MSGREQFIAPILVSTNENKLKKEAAYAQYGNAECRFERREEHTKEK
jgi:hypothetical protein